MGQCYSCQANSLKGPYCPNADMSTRPMTQGRPSGLGSNRTANPAYRYKQVPQYNGKSPSQRNSNENPEDRAALAIIDDNSPVSRPKSVKTEYNTNLNRFGFRPANKLGKSDSNSNVMTFSSDSLDNIEIDLVKKKDQTTYGPEKGTRPRSYEHPESRNWKMIDDSSTTDSRSVSTHGTQGSQEGADSNGNGQSQTKAERTSLASKLRSGDKKSGSSPAGPAGKSLVKPGKGPIPKFSPKTDRWVRAEAAEPVARQPSPSTGKNRPKSKSPNRDKSQLPKPGGQEPSQSRLMTRARGWFNSYGQRSSQLEQNKNKPEDNNKSKSGLSKLKPTKVQIAEKEPVKESKKPVPAVSPVSPDGSEPSFDESEKSKVESNMKDSFTKDSGIGSDSLEAQDLISRESQPLKPSLVKKDSVDAGSVCSLNSDDLMLDLDINFDEDVLGTSSSTLERSSFFNTSHATSITPAREVPLEAGKPYSAPHRDRSGSQSSDAERPSSKQPPGEGTVTAKPPVRPGSLLRRHTDGAISRPRTNSWKEERAKNSLNEALSELSALIETSPSPSGTQTEAPGVQRRNPKLHRSNRPASFPGPSLSQGAVGGADEVRSPLKPPKMGPSLGDEEQLYMDAFSHRHMMQDITAIKTMALKLKRVLQEEDLGSHAWKNGYKYGSSQPGSPLSKESQYSFSGPPSSSTTPTMDSIIHENFQLRQQLTDMQHRLDEQDRTIQRLQEKMNKTELSNKGKSPTPASSQKPRLGGNKGVPRPGFAGGSGSALTKHPTRGRSEISSYSAEQPPGGSSEQVLSEGEGSRKVGPSVVHSGPDKDNKENIGTTKPTASAVEHRLTSTGARAKNIGGGSKPARPTSGLKAPSASGSRVKRHSGTEKKSTAAAGGDETDKSATAKKESTSKSDKTPNKGVQSRLPSLNVKKVTRKADQLQSFSKISKK